MVIEPVENLVVLIFIEFHLNRVEWLHIEHVGSVIQRGLLVVKRREPHSFEMFTIALLSAHHNPHGAPLRSVDRLDHLWCLVHESNSACDVVQDFTGALLFPGHGHVLKKFENCVGDVLEGAKVDALILAEALGAHVTVVFDYLA